MAKTAVAGIIIPTEFEKNAIERTAELSAFGQCGIVEHAPLLRQAVRLRRGADGLRDLAERHIAQL